MSWQRSTVAPDSSHHLCDGRPLYSARFTQVQQFHAPGLAPARNGSGAFHITPSGAAAYAARFTQTWGFYEERAAVEDGTGWLHILLDGRPLGNARYAWCGNFQEHRCTVRERDGRYRHIRTDGTAAYPATYLYAGDFRDGAAVVRCPERGWCTHIDPNGERIHNTWFVDLDVFHKRFARARDARGWFHIDRQGRATSSQRFAEVEPFYNGQARVLTHDGQYLVIDVAGVSLARVGRCVPTHQLSVGDETAHR